MLDNFHTDESETILASTGWLCPDIDSMNIQNFYGSGLSSYSSYMFNLVYCDDAASSLNYFDPNCETDHAIANSVMEAANTFVFSKAVTTYFNPDEYTHNYVMNYTSEVLQYFKYSQSSTSRSITYNIAQNKVYFSDNKFYDLEGTSFETKTIFYGFSFEMIDYFKTNNILSLLY